MWYLMNDIHIFKHDLNSFWGSLYKRQENLNWERLNNTKWKQKSKRVWHRVGVDIQYPGAVPFTTHELFTLTPSRDTNTHFISKLNTDALLKSSLNTTKHVYLQACRWTSFTEYTRQHKSNSAWFERANINTRTSWDLYLRLHNHTQTHTALITSVFLQDTCWTLRQTHPAAHIS